MKIRLFFNLFIFLGLLSLILVTPLKAQDDEVATSSPEIKESTASATIKILEKKEDITEPTPEVKGKLERFLAEHPVKPLNITNFLQHAIRQMVNNGVPANTIVLILLFPIVATIIAASRHIVGIRGFGIFLPAILSVVFIATGIIEGLLLFLIIITVATLTRMILRKLKLQYLPRMALLILSVSLAVLATFLVAPFFHLTTIMTLSIFPILILILLTDSFIGIHITMSIKQAIKMTGETIVIALICSYIMQLEFIQKFVLIRPEITVITLAILDIFMGKYVGLRFFEYKKFKHLLK